MKLSKTYNLKAVNPGLASQWHPLKNGDLKPEDVTPGSGKKVWWLCEKGHEWQEKVYLQDRSQGCPFCHKEKMGIEKSVNKFGRKTSRGLYRPFVCSKRSYVSVRIEDKMITRKKGKIKEIRKFTIYARYVYGLDRIPEGWVIWHIDGNSLNNNIENLECISRDELLKRMRMRKYNKNP